MYRACIEKATGKLIEMQSGEAELGTLTQNAVNAGYAEADIEEKYVTNEEYAAILAMQPPSPHGPPSIEERISAIEDVLITIL